MILFVCTGNVCRSPLAERWLLHALRRCGVDDVLVSSAGVRALVGRPMDPDTAHVGEDLGLDCSNHVARQLDRSSLIGVGLVLTANQAQRRDVVEVYPPAVQYTFGIRQLGRLLAASPEPPPVLAPDQRGDLTRALRRFATAQRGRPVVGKALSNDDDVIDPYARPPEVHRRSAEQMLPALQQIADALCQLRLGAMTA